MAPQEAYEVGGLAVGSRFLLRVTAHSSAGRATTTVLVSPRGGNAETQPAPYGPLLPEEPLLHSDPRIIASAAASSLALALTAAALLLCHRRRKLLLRRRDDVLSDYSVTFSVTW